MLALNSASSNIEKRNSFFLSNALLTLHMKVIDDQIILDKTVADQVSMWKSSKGLSDKMVTDHTCSGEACSFYQIGDVFVCEKTGHVHGMKQYQDWLYCYLYVLVIHF